MQGFDSITPLWDFSQSDPSHFANLADDDFLAMLSKQFGTDASLPNQSLDSFTLPESAIDPSKLTNLPAPVPPPPLSDDSSPSPPSMNDSGSRRQSAVYGDDREDSLKRKASDDEDFEEGPSHKNPHLSCELFSSSSCLLILTFSFPQLTRSQRLLGGNRPATLTRYAHPFPFWIIVRDLCHYRMSRAS